MRQTCTVIAALGIIALSPATAAAQESAGGGGLPELRLSVGGGMLFPRTDSDVFDVMTEHLTISRSDLRSKGMEAEIGLFLARRIEVIAGATMNRATQSSRFRDRTDGGDPIVQNTQLRVGPTLYVGGKVHLLPDLRWQSTLNPFITGGVGRTLSYKLRMWGRFYDEQEAIVFDGDFRSRGSATSTFAGAGVNARLTERLFLVGSGRYFWTNATLGGDYWDLEPIDLSGLRVSVGIGIRR